MKLRLLGFLFASLFAAAPAYAEEVAPQSTERRPWITDPATFDVLCSYEETRSFLTFRDQQVCRNAIQASASHCDRVLTEDFAKYEGASDFQSRRTFFEGAAQGCFVAQMNGQTSGKFGQLLQLMAQRRKAQR